MAQVNLTPDSEALKSIIHNTITCRNVFLLYCFPGIGQTRLSLRARHIEPAYTASPYFSTLFQQMTQQSLCLAGLQA